MFTIKANPTFKATVKIPGPGAKPGELTLIFKHLSRDKTADFFARTTKSKATDGVVLSEIVAGWEDVDAEFSAEALTELCQEHHSAVAAILDAYTAELRGAQAKN